MATQAVLFGGVGTLLECSEIQRASFNEAFTTMPTRIVVSNLADLDKAVELNGTGALATRISGWLASTCERAA